MKETDTIDFEEKALEGIEKLETQQETLIKNYDQLDKDTKKAFEELTVAKNKVNELNGIVIGLQKVNLQLSRERRMAFGDPIKRIAQDEEMSARFNAAVRLCLQKSGENFAKPWLEKLGKIGKAIGEDSSPGSTLIDDVLLNEIYDTLQSFGKWATLGVRRMGTKQTKMPVKTARPTAQFILTEAGTIADDANKAGTSVTLEVEVLGVLLNVALQLIQDSEFNITEDVMGDFVEAYNQRLDFAAFTADGTGDGNNGGMTGLFNFGTAAVAAAGNTLAENLQLDDFIRCLTTVDSAVISRPCKWWSHPQILARFILVRDANGRSIFMTAVEAPTRGGIGSILGYPVEMVEVAPSTNAASKKLAAFGDPNSFVVGPRTDFAFEASDHFRWNTYERSFRGIGRAGVKGRRAAGTAILTTPAA